MNHSQLFNLIRKKRTFLCVGLDSDLNKIPAHLLSLEDPVFEFNKRIIEATLPYVIAYKPNLAFYESRGIDGLISLKKTMDYLKQYRQEVFTIADAKRGDIGNTSSQYARAVVDEENSGCGVDAITVAPDMGEDSVKTFLDFPGKWAIVLALTSNKGANDFQMIRSNEDILLFESVLNISSTWGSSENMMYVVGATRAEMLAEVRRIVPDHFLLVPGVGAQGGSLQDVAKFGMNKNCGLIVNASRSILFASGDKDFDQLAAKESKVLQAEMETLLKTHGLI